MSVRLGMTMTHQVVKLAIPVGTVYRHHTVRDVQITSSGVLEYV